MNFKEIVLDLLGIYVEKKTPRSKVLNVLKKLIPKKIDIELIRLGENNDGGYLLPNDLKGINRNYSAGVGFLTQFEKQLEKNFHISTNLLDLKNINKKILPKKGKFVNKKLSIDDNKNEISINTWIKDNDKEITLKIDIEGDEYSVLTSISKKNLKKIRILIIEFHDLRNLRSLIFFNIFEKIINRLNNYFYPCHFHINNSSKVKNLHGIKIPDMIEMTFIRKNRIKKNPKKNAKLPHPLDQKTVLNKKEILIDKNWYH